jgi:hypothetical protein
MKGVIGCRGPDCLFSGVQLLSFVVSPVFLAFSVTSWLLFRKFEQTGNRPTSRAWDIFADFRIYIFLVAMWLTVFDGMLVVQSGTFVWRKYGKGYPDAAATWGTFFSITNSVSTFVLSGLTDLALKKCEGLTRNRIFGCLSFVFGLVPASVAIAFRLTDNEMLFGVLMSGMGMLFGVGMAQLPALVSETFGNDKYGFAYGIAQIGSLVASGSTLAIVKTLEKGGITAVFAISAGMHLVIAVCMLVLNRLGSCRKRKRKEGYEEGELESAFAKEESQLSE